MKGFIKKCLAKLNIKRFVPNTDILASSVSSRHSIPDLVAIDSVSGFLKIEIG